MKYKFVNYQTLSLLSAAITWYSVSASACGATGLTPRAPSAVIKTPLLVCGDLRVARDHLADAGYNVVIYSVSIPNARCLPTLEAVLSENSILGDVRLATYPVYNATNTNLLGAPIEYSSFDKKSFTVTTNMTVPPLNTGGHYGEFNAEVGSGQTVRHFGQLTCVLPVRR